MNLNSTPSRLRHDRRFIKPAIIMITGLAYLAAYVSLYSILGHGTGILALLPVIASASFFGLRAGVLVAVLALPGHFLLEGLLLDVDPGWRASQPMTWIAPGGLIIVGAAVGHMRSLYSRVARQKTVLWLANERLASEIADRRSAEDRLSGEQRLLHTLMDNMPDGIFFKDRHCKFTRVNKAALTDLGLDSPEEAIGKTDADFLGEESRRPAEASCADEQELIRSGRPLINVEEEFKWPGQKEKRWYLTTKVPIQDEVGRITGLVGISREFTDRVHAETELRKRSARIENQAERLRLVSQIATLISSKATHQEIRDASLDGIFKVIGCDRASYARISPENGRLYLSDWRGSVPSPGPDKPIPIGLSSVEVVEKHLPFVIHSGTDELEECGLGSSVSATVQVDGKAIGAISAWSINKDAFDEFDAELLRTLAIHVGVSLESANRLAEARESDDLRTLSSVSQAVSTSLVLTEMLNRALEAILASTSFEAAEIWLVENDSTLRVAAFSGSSGSTLATCSSFDLGEGFPGIVAQSKKHLAIDVTRDRGRLLSPSVENAGIRKVCAFPMLRGQRLIGILVLASKSPPAVYQQEQPQVPAALADIIGTAIENCQLFDRVGERAMIEERERIALELHDTLNQALAYVSTQGSAIGVLLKAGDHSEAERQIDTLVQAAQELASDVREEIFELRIASDRAGEIWPALFEYLEQVTTKHNIALTIEGREALNEADLHGPKGLHVIRIIQEAVSNVRKHASATALSVRFEIQPVGLSVYVEDNGVGFNQNDQRNDDQMRYGIRAMHERARHSGGRLTIRSSAGRGTSVGIFTPLNNQAMADEIT